jgi:hypothetical protein
MALTWDITNCKDSEELLTEEQWDTTQAMIFATMGVGIGKITEDNWPEFYARLLVAEYYGTDFTPALVRRYVGLHTNVFPLETRAKWLKRVIGSRLDEAVHRAKRVEANA